MKSPGLIGSIIGMIVGYLVFRHWMGGLLGFFAGGWVARQFRAGMGQEGSVAWQFTRRSYFNIPGGSSSYDDLFEVAAESGADDVLEEEDYFEIVGPVDVFKTIHDQLKSASITPNSSGLRMDPNQEVELGLDETLQVMKLIDTLEELDDVQEVYSNLKITDEALAGLAE